MARLLTMLANPQDWLRVATTWRGGRVVKGSRL